MEKKGLRKKDILRMDGLLPPTRRLPVCDAISGAPGKKKDKKWSLGGILRRISSIKDYDSSSNDEEIVYCKKTPKKPAKLNKQSDEVVLHSIENNSEYDKRIRIENNVRHQTDSPSYSRRDSLHSRSSDGSLDGLGKKIRKNKLKARAEAKRDHLCADSSSDDDCRRSNNSLNRFHGSDSMHNGQRGNICNRKTRAARTERYIKRLSRDDGNGSLDTLNELHHKRYSSEYTADDEQHRTMIYADVNGSCRPPVHPRRTVGVSPVQKSSQNSRTFPAHRSSAENLRQADYMGLPNIEMEFPNDFRRYSTGHYITDMNQNNTYGKVSRNAGRDVDHQIGNFFTYPAKNMCHYSEPFDQINDRRLINSDNRPPEPPPRDPRYRVLGSLGYGYISYPTNKHQDAPNSYEREENETNGLSKSNWRNFRSYGSNNEIARCDMIEREGNRTESNPRTELRNSLEYINNKYNSSRHCASELAYKETEAMKCRRRNTRNDQLNCNDANYSTCKAKNKSTNICESSKRETAPSYISAASSDWLSRKSPCDRIISRSITPTRDVDKRVERRRKENDKEVTPTEEAAERERRRSSKNLEEALTELEAIYNSLRLGDEDLLDRAERRSMEEFSLKQGKSELDAVTTVSNLDSPDRTKDDMAYRRMHPKERPTSLSDIAGQSNLFNISYLITSPVLSRKDLENDYAHASSTGSFRRDEPDVTRDDVVYRSMNRANNSLKVIDPQPPFGIPLGPVTAATESDYLHTTPTKSEQPRSPYIPQCEPDVVTDDLAYRSLRKDACMTRNTTEGKSDMPRDSTAVCGIKKKRAVRSMSANLYGLINHDRIHLRREPSLDTIKDDIQDAARNFDATPERPGYFRRVVSDGELSDNDARKRKEPVKECGIDINGNHPTVVAYRKKLSNTYVSPETTMSRQSPKKEKKSSLAELSNAMLLPWVALEDEFWHLRSDSNASNTNSHSTEADFSAYSRLCQDLVNMIKSGDESPNTNDAGVTVASPDKSNDIVAKLEADELPASSHAMCSLERRYSGLQRTVRANDRYENEAAESPGAFSTNSAEPESESTEPTKNLDFYLRVADENVKLIAAAFGSVADHLRDSRLTARKNSSTSYDVSEMENQSGSTRSSTLYSQDDTNDDQSQATPVITSKFEEIRVASKRDSFTSNEGDQSSSSPNNHFEQDTLFTADAELDLSRAVRDLQLAAASLCEHGPEIENLGVGRNRKVDARVHNVTPVTVTSTDENEDSPMRKINLIADALRQKQEYDQEDDKRVTPITAINADKNPIHKISYLANVLTQEQERDQEEMTVLPVGIAKTRRDSCEESSEGELTVCELDRKSCYTKDAWSCVTNLVTCVTITTYSMLLLACLFALLLANVAAS